MCDVLTFKPNTARREPGKRMTTERLQVTRDGDSRTPCVGSSGGRETNDTIVMSVTDSPDQEEWLDDPPGFDDHLSQMLDTIESSQVSSTSETVPASQETVILAQDETPDAVEEKSSDESPVEIPGSQEVLIIATDEKEAPEKKEDEVEEPATQSQSQVSEVDEMTRSGCVIDARLQELDPSPDPFRLFRLFDDRFFQNRLRKENVRIEWSEHMTASAGICQYFPKDRKCVIKLSIPLLGDAPRKDVVHTLLHEMIHAELFVTGEDDNREEHGPIFTNRMALINTKGECYVSLQHTFPIKGHIWTCNGVSKKKPPYFGIVKRTNGRAPGPKDKWFADHHSTCDGLFEKTAGPDMKPPSKPKPVPKRTPKKKGKGKSVPVAGMKSITSFFQVVKKTFSPKHTSKSKDKDLLATTSSQTEKEIEVIDLD